LQRCQPSPARSCTNLISGCEVDGAVGRSK
jgi:hypothetical protein